MPERTDDYGQPVVAVAPGLAFGGDGYGPETLLCPECDMSFTHIDRVTVHAREEDAGPKDTRVVSVDVPDGSPWPESQRPAGLPGNPSSRRSGLVIEGNCENGHRWMVTFEQHKGETRVHAYGHADAKKGGNR